MWTKTILMIALQLGASGADAYLTDHNLAVGGREHNPIAAPFMGSRAGRIAYFSVSVGIKIAIPHLLRQHHHANFARTAEILGIADSTVGAAQSAHARTK